MIKKRDTKTNEFSKEIKNKISWFRKRLRQWFKINRRAFPWREPTRTPYEILVAEVMLQRTVAANVSHVYPSFITKYPSFERLSDANLEELEEILKPLGLWRLKARVFKEIARTISNNNGLLPDTRNELEKLENIGQYTASVILTTIHSKPEPFVDVNTARVIDRVFEERRYADIRYDVRLHDLIRLIVKDPRESLALNWAMLDFGALICKARNPLCLDCPLNGECLFFKKQQDSNKTANNISR